MQYRLVGARSAYAYFPARAYREALDQRLRLRVRQEECSPECDSPSRVFAALIVVSIGDVGDVACISSPTNPHTRIGDDGLGRHPLKARPRLDEFPNAIQKAEQAKQAERDKNDYVKRRCYDGPPPFAFPYADRCTFNSPFTFMRTSRNRSPRK